MIAHSLKTIFVHIPKTAGQSIEQVFLSHLGLDQQSRSVLLLREKRDHEQGPPRLAHLTAAEYTGCDFLSQQQFHSYFSFAFVRNPWSRVKSFYTYLQFYKKMSFTEFVLCELEKQMQGGYLGWFLKPQTEYVFDSNDQQLIDFVGRFESLQEDFDAVMQQLGLPQTELPFLNSSEAVAKLLNDENEYIQVTQHSYYDNDAIVNKIAELYARDVALLGYEPD